MKLRLSRNEFLIALSVNHKLLRDKRTQINYKVIDDSNCPNIILTLKSCKSNEELLVGEKELNKYYKFSSGINFKILNK